MVGEPIALPDPVNPAVSPDGVQVYVTNNFGDSVSVLDPGSPFRGVLSPIPVGDQPRGLAVSPDGAWVYVAVGSPIEVGPLPRGIAVPPDSRWVYVASEHNNSVSVIDTGLR